MTLTTIEITVQCVALTDSAVEAAWVELETRSGVSSPFLSWDWYGALAEVLDLASAVEVVICRRGTTPVGLLPVETTTRRGLRTLGVAGWYWFTPDHLDVVAAVDDRGVVAHEIAAHIAKRRDWDVVDMDALAEGSALGPALKAVLNRPRFLARADEPTPIRALRLVTDEGPLVSKRARKQVRRELKLIEEQGGTLEMVTAPSEVVDLLRQLMSLHESRFGDRSTVFATPERRLFHLAVARRMSEAGRARIARLRIGDVDVALSYLLCWESTLYFYSSGLRPDLGRTPGFAVRAWAVTRAAEEGFTTADFLRGEYEWKQRLADHQLDDVRVRIVKLTPRVVASGIRRVLTPAKSSPA